MRANGLEKRRQFILFGGGELVPIVGLGLLFVIGLGVVRRVDRLPEIVLDKCTGALVERGNDQEMAAAIVEILNNPVLADKITADAVTRHTVPYLPSNLGDEMLHHHRGLSPGAAVAGLAAWVLVLAAVAAFSLRGRDA